jgi:hypothetical protein
MSWNCDGFCPLEISKKPLLQDATAAAEPSPIVPSKKSAVYDASICSYIILRLFLYAWLRSTDEWEVGGGAKQEIPRKPQDVQEHMNPMQYHWNHMTLR